MMKTSNSAHLLANTTFDRVFDFDEFSFPRVDDCRCGGLLCGDAIL